MESYRYKQEINSGVEEYKSDIEFKKKEILKTLFDYQTLDWQEKEKKISEMIQELLDNEDFDHVIDLGRQALDFYKDEHGIETLNELDISQPENAVLLTEAINWAAKTISEVFYELKPAMIFSSWKLGGVLGVEQEDNRWPIYYLHAPNVGVASFHDPDREVYHINEKFNSKRSIKEYIPDWTHGWSKVPRQDEAFDLIKAMSNKIDNKEAEYYLKRMAVRTSPGNNLYEKFKNAKNPPTLDASYEYDDGPISNKIIL